MAYETQGTRFFWSTAVHVEGSTVAGSTSQEINGVVNWSGLGGNSPVIDVTDLNSTAREKRSGLRDPGELTLGLIYNATDAGQVALQAAASGRTRHKMVIHWSTVDANGQGCEFLAFCGGLEISGDIDDKVMGSAQIVISYGVTHTTYATS